MTRQQCSKMVLEPGMKLAPQMLDLGDAICKRLFLEQLKELRFNLAGCRLGYQRLAKPHSGLSTVSH